MKKVLLLTTLLLSGYAVNAQVDTITEYFTGTPALSGVTGQPGYVSGNNGYGDKGKYMRFNYENGMSVSGSMTSVLMWVPVKEDNGGSMDVKVIDFTGGTAGAELASVTVDLANIDTAVAALQVAEGAVGYNVSVTFPTAVALTPASDVLVGIELPATAGDTVALIHNSNGDFPAAETHTWELWSDDTWNDVETAWSGLEVAFAIFPIVDGVPATSLTENAINASAYPNPASDVFNIKLDAEGATATLISMDGKVVATEEFNGSHVSFDVANLVEGAYIYEVVAADGTVIRDTFIKQ